VGSLVTSLGFDTSAGDSADFHLLQLVGSVLVHGNHIDGANRSVCLSDNTVWDGNIRGKLGRARFSLNTDGRLLDYHNFTLSEELILMLE